MSNNFFQEIDSIHDELERMDKAAKLGWLTGNHFHLLVREREETVGETIKRIASSYVFYYNKKNERIGHLFQERFKSEPCNDMEYFVTLLREEGASVRQIVSHTGFTTKQVRNLTYKKREIKGKMREY